jgi:hypothetical protein
MRFYEFDLIKPKHPDELVDKGVSAAKSVAKKTISGTKSALGMAGKGLAKVTGMVFRDFDPAMQDLYKDGDSKQNQTQKSVSDDSKKRFKNTLGKSLNNEFLTQDERNELKIGLTQGWFPSMQSPEFKTALEKLINKENLNGSELILLKRVHAKLF